MKPGPGEGEDGKRERINCGRLRVLNFRGHPLSLTSPPLLPRPFPFPSHPLISFRPHISFPSPIPPSAAHITTTSSAL